MRATSATGSRRGRHTRGFTLIELLVVLAILVMMASLLPWALDRALPGRRVAGTAQRVISAIRDAQSTSATTGRAVRLEFDARLGLLDGTRVIVALPASAQIRLFDRDGRPLRELLVQPDGSTTGARFEVRAGTHESTVVVDDMNGRIALEERADAHL